MTVIEKMPPNAPGGDGRPSLLLHHRRLGVTLSATAAGRRERPILGMCLHGTNIPIPPNGQSAGRSTGESIPEVQSSSSSASSMSCASAHSSTKPLMLERSSSSTSIASRMASGNSALRSARVSESTS